MAGASVTAKVLEIWRLSLSLSHPASQPARPPCPSPSQTLYSIFYGKASARSSEFFGSPSSYHAACFFFLSKTLQTALEQRDAKSQRKKSKPPAAAPAVAPAAAPAAQTHYCMWCCIRCGFKDAKKLKAGSFTIKLPPEIPELGTDVSEPRT